MLNPFARRNAARLLSAIALALLFAGPGLAGSQGADAEGCCCGCQ